MLSILQDIIDTRGAFSTNKIDLAASSACQIGFGRDCSQHPLVVDEIDMSSLSLKTTLQSALSRAKRVGEMQVISVYPSCLYFSSGFDKLLT